MSELNSSPAAPASTSSAPAAPASSTATTQASSAPVTAPAAAPVATTEAAPAVTAPATTETPAAAPSDAGKTTLQVLQETFAAKQAEEAAKPAETSADPNAPVKTPEEVEADAVAAAAVAEAEAAAAKPTEETEVKPKVEGDDDLPNFDDFELDPIALAPKELATKIETDPALSAALDGNPELKNQIFANARLAAEAAQYKEVVGSPQEAKVAVEGNATYVGISSAMGTIDDKNPATLMPAYKAMLEASAIRDADGNLQYHPNGALVTTGAVGKFERASFANRLDIFAKEFKAKDDEEGQAAIDILMERAGLRTPSSASESEENMSAEMRAERESIRAERAELDRVKATSAAEVAKAYDTTVKSKIDGLMDAGIGSVLGRATGLNDFSRSVVETNIRAALAKEIRNNPQWRTEMDRISRMPFGVERQREHVKVATRYFQAGLAKHAVAELAKAGASITAKQQAQADKSAARTEAARSETRGSMTTAKSAPVLDEKATLAQVETDLRKTLGRSPTTLELMSENVKRKSQTAAA